MCPRYWQCKEVVDRKQFYGCVQDIDSVRKLFKENNSMDVSIEAWCIHEKKT